MSHIITICSSMQFRMEIIGAAQVLTSNGWSVLTPELSEKSADYLNLSLAERRKAKATFIENHLQRIAKSEAILVLNYEKKGIAGYIGANTLMEIGVAYHLGKNIYLLNEPGEQNCQEEVLALATKFLDGNLELL